jgi:hypothetical protein
VNDDLSSIVRLAEESDQCQAVDAGHPVVGDQHVKTVEVRGHPLPRGRAIPDTFYAMACGRKYAIHDFAKQRIIIGAKDSERPLSEIGAV